MPGIHFQFQFTEARKEEEKVKKLIGHKAQTGFLLSDRGGEYTLDELQAKGTLNLLVPGYSCKGRNTGIK